MVLRFTLVATGDDVIRVETSCVFTSRDAYKENMLVLLQSIYTISNYAHIPCRMQMT